MYFLGAVMFLVGIFINYKVTRALERKWLKYYFGGDADEDCSN